MKAKIHITLKSGVLDPQGRAIENALDHLGFEGVNNVRQGKYIELDLGVNNKELAKQQVTDMCEKLLANTVIEDYQVELVA